MRKNKETDKNNKKIKLKTIILTIAIMFMNLAISNNACADEKKVIINASDGIREVLTANIGKRVMIKTDANESLEGNIVMVGNQLVHIEKLSGKDFYDALVRIDRISSVIIRARGK
jgi:hypothetical protein